MANQDTDPRASPGATVQRYVEAFNNADEDAMAACFANPGVILDGMAPHVWLGPSATREWFREALAESEHLGVSDFAMTVGAPLHDNVRSDAAYYVAPAALSFKVKGRPVTQSGAAFTVALRKVDEQWLITAWSWTKGSGGGVDDARAPDPPR